MSTSITLYGRVAERPNAPVLKTGVPQGTVGSNPTSSEISLRITNLSAMGTYGPRGFDARKGGGSRSEQAFRPAGEAGANPTSSDPLKRSTIINSTAKGRKLIEGLFNIIRFHYASND